MFLLKAHGASAIAAPHKHVQTHTNTSITSTKFEIKVE